MAAISNEREQRRHWHQVRELIDQEADVEDSSHRQGNDEVTSLDTPGIVDIERRIGEKEDQMAFGLPAQFFTGSLWRAARPGNPKWGA